MAYENLILTDSGYEDIIRDKLATDSQSLPDASINRLDGVQLAEAIIIERLPAYAALTGNDLLYLKIATIYCAAALLANQISRGRLKSEKLPDYQYENFQEDMGKKEAGCWKKADEFLAKISTYDYETQKLVEFIGGTPEQVTSATSGTSSPFN